MLAPVTATPASTPTDGADQLSDTERAVHGDLTLPALRAFLDTWSRDRWTGGC